MLENATTLRPLPLDGTLVSQARNSLPRGSIPRILYDGIKRGYTDEAGQGLRVDQLTGLEVERVFRRKSGVPLSVPMPKLYTREQFGAITTEGRAEILKVLTRDAWIWGQSNVSSLASAGALSSEVTDLYETDYIRAWDAFIDDLQFVPASDSRADQRRVADPDVADLAADWPAARHRRPDDARAVAGRGRRERRDRQGDSRRSETSSIRRRRRSAWQRSRRGRA